ANAAQDTAAWNALQTQLQNLGGKSADPGWIYGAGLSWLVGGDTGPLGGATLTKDQVTQLQQAVDTFAQTYTSGTDFSQDGTAWPTLWSRLDSIAQDVAAKQFAASHVLTKDQVTQFQQAVATFAQNYTNGANIDQDVAAYTTLQASLAKVLTGQDGYPMLALP